jgi:hypothetical protein
VDLAVAELAISELMAAWETPTLPATALYSAVRASTCDRAGRAHVWSVNIQCVQRGLEVVLLNAVRVSTCGRINRKRGTHLP